MKPMVISTAYTPIAAGRRRTNHLPTIARLTTDSALCPSPRVSVTVKNNPHGPVTRLIRITSMPSAITMIDMTMRDPRTSIS